MGHPDPEHVTTILVSHLAGNTEGLDVGYGTAPETPTPSYPYLIVDPLAPFDVDGPLNSINEIHSAEWQVMSVGLTMQQALSGIAASRDRLTGASQPDFTAASYRLAGTPQIVPAGGAAEAEQAEKPPLFLFTETYRFLLVPV